MIPLFANDCSHQKRDFGTRGAKRKTEKYDIKLVNWEINFKRVQKTTHIQNIHALTPIIV